MSDDAPGAGEPIEIHSCDDVLSHVFEFLDHETGDERRALIAEHLEECSSCLREFGIEQEFKALVRRRCGGDAPPAVLLEGDAGQLDLDPLAEAGRRRIPAAATADQRLELLLDAELPQAGGAVLEVFGDQGAPLVTGLVVEELEDVGQHVVAGMDLDRLAGARSLSLIHI